MYRLLIIISLFLSSHVLIAQQNNTQQELFDSLLVEGIRVFDAPIKKRNYPKAINYLEQAVLLNPDNARAHYYLAYAYSGKNANDAKTLPLRSKELCIKASEEMEKVIKIDSGFIPPLVLSPYSKITSEWGSLALRYLYLQQNDSVLWALQQGRERGGFSPFFRAYYKIVLEQCTPNSMLFSYGDDSFWNLFYIQYADSFRKDVAHISLSLLNTIWYQETLNNQSTLNFKVAQKNDKNYTLVKYSDSLINIPIFNENKKFSWNFQSHGSNPYFLLYGDIAMLNLITTNEFKRPIYFTKGVERSSYYNLQGNLENQIALDYLNPVGKSEMQRKAFDVLAENLLNLFPLVNQKSGNEIQIANNIRYAIAKRIYYDWSRENDKDHARYLMQLLHSKVPASKYPYIDPAFRNTMNQFKSVMMEEY